MAPLQPVAFTGFAPIDPVSQRPPTFIMSREEGTRRALDLRARMAAEQFLSRGLPVMPLVNQPFINLFKGPTTRLFQEPFAGGGAGGFLDVIEAARVFNPFREIIEAIRGGR